VQLEPCAVGIRFPNGPQVSVERVAQYIDGIPQESDSNHPLVVRPWLVMSLQKCKADRAAVFPASWCHVMHGAGCAGACEYLAD
jgi:hypothetical protein